MSNRGIRPISPSFDTVGPLARSVEDIAALVEVMSGWDPEDEWSVDHERPTGLLAASRARSLEGMTIGIPTTYFFDDVEPSVLRATRTALDDLTRLGAHLVPVEIRNAEQANADATLVIRAEAYARYRRALTDTPELIGPDVRDRLALGAEITGEQVATATMRMAGWRRDIHRELRKLDAVVSPTVRIPPTTIESVHNMTTTTASGTALTYPWSAARVPGLSVPSGFDDGGLPVGLQIVSAPWSEANLVAIGAAYQAVTGHHRQRPGLP